MKFYRQLSKIKAISFDLDDTLYSNKPVMQAIGKKMIAYFADLPAIQAYEFAKHQELNHHFWSPFRQQAIIKQPDLAHDVERLRLITYQIGFKFLGFSKSIADQMAQAALSYFITIRSDFILPKESSNLLDKLTDKYPLIAISNGNVDTKILGISHYFQHVYHAGWQHDGSFLRQKPTSDMFNLACKQLGIKHSELLHVGDCGRADIRGALDSGCQTAWLSCYDVGKPITQLPHVELNSVNELQAFVS